MTLRIGKNVSNITPKISIVIPAYNTAEFISEALQSVLAQTFTDIEIILVNDGSPDTDRLESVIEEYLEDIVYIKQENSGAGVARNTAITNSRGEFVAFLDGDDVWFREFLESQLEYLESNGLDMVYCDADLFGSSVIQPETYMVNAPSMGIVDLDSILDSRCNVITSGTLSRKSSIEKAGMFENEKVQAEDFHLWLRMAQSGAKIGYQRKSLLKYRVRVDSLSGDSISRVNRGIDVFERVLQTIDMSDEQRQRLTRRISDLESDLSVERGKVFLLSGDYPAAVAEFEKANRHRRSPKLAVIMLLTRFAPKLLVKIYRSNRSTEIEFVPVGEK